MKNSGILRKWNSAIMYQLVPHPGIDITRNWNIPKSSRTSKCWTVCIIEGSLEVKLPIIWVDRWKQRGEESEKRREEERRWKRESLRRKKIQVREKMRKGRKVAKHCVCPLICGSGGSKIRLTKAAGAEPCGQMRGEKLHAAVARSTFPSQNVQSTSAPEHF